MCKNGKVVGNTNWILPLTCTLNNNHLTSSSVTLTFSTTGAVVKNGDVTRTYTKSTDTWA
jgi:hypothetical protein